MNDKLIEYLKKIKFKDIINNESIEGGWKINSWVDNALTLSNEIKECMFMHVDNKSKNKHYSIEQCENDLEFSMNIQKIINNKLSFSIQDINIHKLENNNYLVYGKYSNGTYFANDNNNTFSVYNNDYFKNCYSNAGVVKGEWKQNHLDYSLDYQSEECKLIIEALKNKFVDNRELEAQFSKEFNYHFPKAFKIPKEIIEMSEENARHYCDLFINSDEHSHDCKLLNEKEENISNHTTMKNLLYLSMEDAETNSKLHIFENYKQMLIYLAEIIDNELKLNNGKYDGYFLSYEDLLKLGITEYFPQINNKVSFVTGLFKNKS